MGKLSFSGHESFICKQFWLKKGADFVSNPQMSFAADDAVVELGVGKNMVRSIRFWLKAFDIIEDNDQLTRMGRYLFSEKGKDPYLESIGSVWLLHYLLVKTKRASLYGLVFNDFRRLRPEFQFEQLQAYVERTCEEQGTTYSSNTIKRDITVLINNYVAPSLKKKSDLEDDFSGLLYELRILEKKSKADIIRDTIVDYHVISPDYRDTLPWQIVLYSILDNDSFSNSITFQDLYNAPDSPGSVFALSQEGLYRKIQQIIEFDPACSYSETAGNRVLQISTSLINKFSVLDAYYPQ
ncbi:hypothetical protein LEM8419_02150 [Neolewinella maritima]|uniref:DUF4007 domain-containing protein n=1 Tax=Neolewinella maritima TaxID=1383882 RepID=A0ABM9B2B3_9BACT|nr:DUF4007 family protein [Neolewinella maritima]CAH1001251.1 hypothetical protein LEM8419_02150 [Neolewinella maritima]